MGFKGLLARGLITIGKHGKEQEWAWIFIIEGLLVIITLEQDQNIY
jgi:hypothetical protein